MRLKGFELAVCGIDLFRAIGGLYEAKTSLISKQPHKKKSNARDTTNFTIKSLQTDVVS